MGDALQPVEEAETKNHTRSGQQERQPKYQLQEVRQDRCFRYRADPEMRGRSYACGYNETGETLVSFRQYVRIFTGLLLGGLYFC